jgi:hypothetical protein
MRTTSLLSGLALVTLTPSIALGQERTWEWHRWHLQVLFVK